APTTPVETGKLPAAAPVTKPATPPTEKVVATAPKAPTAPATPKTGGGSYLVQIGAFSSPTLADKGWNDAAALAPGMAAGKGKKVETVDRDGKTLYRTSVTGFADQASAKAFCDRLKAAGKSCFVR
ncbi:SPOR domain-containing protein, partial [Caulobacter sp. SLTY]|uniref:SPOR domain-containing protein n=1 Tax=Caulobacter sp. SLTY TaxID=2683262 RepID=UPI00196B2CAC